MCCPRRPAASRLGGVPTCPERSGSRAVPGTSGGPRPSPSCVIDAEETFVVYGDDE